MRPARGGDAHVRSSRPRPAHLLLGDEDEARRLPRTRARSDDRRWSTRSRRPPRPASRRSERPRARERRAGQVRTVHRRLVSAADGSRGRTRVRSCRRPRALRTHTTAGKLAELQPAQRRGAARRAPRPRWPSAAPRARRPPASASSSCSTRAASSRPTRSPATAARDFGLERNRPIGDGVITGYGTVDGRPVCVFSQDATVFGGALGEVYGEKIVKVMDLALKTGCPVIGINEGSGARIQEGIMGLALYGDIFYRNVHRLRRRPADQPDPRQLRRRPRLLPRAHRLHAHGRQGRRTCSSPGPDVIKTVTGEDVTIEDLGGARAHNSKSGVAHFMSADEDEVPRAHQDAAVVPAVQQPVGGAGLRRAATRLAEEPLTELDTFIPDSNNAPYDMHTSSRRSSTTATSSRSRSCGRTNIVIGFGRIEGRSVGVVGNNPMQLRRHARHRRRPRRPPGSCAPATRSTCRC